MASRPVKKFKAGTTIFFRIETRDLTDVDHPLFSPATTPQIMLRKPDGTVALNFTTMTTVESGVFSYSYQTTAVTGPMGVWQVAFKIINLTTTVMTLETDAFELVP